MSLVEEKIAQLAYELPATPKAMANYVTVRRTGNFLYTSGTGCFVNGKSVYQGRLGKDLTIEQGYEAARLTMLNLLSSIKGEIGSLENIHKIVKVLGFVNSSDDFFDQAKVINGASDLLVDVLSEKGEHARSAIGTAVLPGNTPVIIEMIVEIQTDRVDD